MEMDAFTTITDMEDIQNGHGSVERSGPYTKFAGSLLEQRPYDFIEEYYNSIQNNITRARLSDNGGNNQEKPELWMNTMISQIHKDILKLPYRNEIPFLNSMDEDELKKSDGKVVRFRCMVQEMYDPAMFKYAGTVQNRSTGLSRTICSLYRDSMKLDENSDEYIVDDKEPFMYFKEMELIHCVSVPGLNKWTNEQIFGRQEGRKRKVDNNMSLDQLYSTFSFPLKEMYDNEINKACIMKMYLHPSGLILNDVVEFYGILDLDKDDDEIPNHNDIFDFDKLDDATAEKMVREPDPMLVQRMHVLSFVKIDERDLTNPNLDDCTMTNLSDRLDICGIGSTQSNDLQSILLETFSAIFMGDSMVARYILWNLVSMVNLRLDGVPIGSLPIAINNSPDDIGTFFYEILEKLVPKSVKLDFHEAIPTMEFSPRKDMRVNKLLSGTLQLTNGTNLVVLKPNPTSKQLSESTTKKAAKNAYSLTKLAELQTLNYGGFIFGIQIQIDIPIVTIAYGTYSRSLKGYTLIPLKPVAGLPAYEDVKAKIRKILESKELLERLRTYISFSRVDTPFEIDEDVNSAIVSSFVQKRGADLPIGLAMTSDDFNHTLILSRYQLRLDGKSKLDFKTWEKAQEINANRKIRVHELSL